MKFANTLLLFAACLLLSAPAGGSGAADPREEMVEQFRARVGGYAQLHRSLDHKLPRLDSGAIPDQISAHQRALAKLIRQARQNANQGDLFGSAEPYFRRLIGIEMKGKQGASARKIAQEGNPVNEPGRGRPIVLAVNAPYPPDLPVSSVPALLLLRLPALPEELNYRFVGKDLILHDTGADLIVDFIVNAIP